MREETRTKAPDPADPRLSDPAIMEANRRVVEKGFWKKLARWAKRVPFAADALAAYYCALDPKTPLRVRGVLLAALAYFVVPSDLIPDVIAVLGFTDDATVMLTAISVVSGYIKPQHRQKAAEALRDDSLEPEQAELPL